MGSDMADLLDRQYGDAAVLSRPARRRSVFARLALATVAVAALLSQSPAVALASESSSGVTSSESQLTPPPPSSLSVNRQATAPSSSLPASKPQMDMTPSAPKQSADGTAKHWLLEKRGVLGDAPDMVRYVANECVLAGVAGAAVAVALTVSGGTVGPVASAALGVTPEMSAFGITMLGCVAGAAAGVASVVAIYAWDEPETLKEVAYEQVENVKYAATAVASAVGDVISRPQDVMYAAASGAWQVAASFAYGAATVAQGAQWAASGAVYGVGSVVASAAESAGSWWYGQPTQSAPEVNYDVANIPEPNYLGHNQSRVY